jgi:hypothetical protein
MREELDREYDRIIAYLRATGQLDQEWWRM